MSRPTSPANEGKLASPVRSSLSPSPSRRPTSPDGAKAALLSPSHTRIKTNNKFSENDFENKRESIDPELRKKQLQAKMRGIKLDPKEWTRQELFEKMSAIFNIVYENSILKNSSNDERTPSPSKLISPSKGSQATSSNVVSEIHVLGGIKLTNDEIIIFNEFCRRNTEIKVINLTNSGITDDYLKQILQGTRLVKCCKWLNLNQNFITMTGLDELVRIYQHANQQRKRLEKVTLQGNLQLTYENGYHFIQSFLNIDQINTIPINELKQHGGAFKMWDLSSQEIRSFELGIICFLLKTYLHQIEEINFANNHINAKGFYHILDTVTKHLEHCHTIDMSGNDVTNNGYDFSSINKLKYILQSSTQLKYVILNNVPHLTNELYDSILRSNAINRSLDRSKNNFYFFNDYLKEVISFTGEKTEKSFQERKMNLLNWIPNPNTIDEEFIKRNRLPICDIKFTFYDAFGEDINGSSIDEGDDKSSRKGSSSGKRESQKKKDKDIDDNASLMSKVSYDGPSEPNTSDKIVNGFKLRWIQPKYDENLNLITKRKKTTKR